MSIIDTQRGFIIRWVTNPRNGNVTSKFVHLRPEWWVTFVAGETPQLFHERNMRKLEKDSRKRGFEYFACMNRASAGLLISNHRDHLGINESNKEIAIEIGYVNAHGHVVLLVVMWDITKEALNLRILESVRARYRFLGVEPPDDLSYITAKL